MRRVDDLEAREVLGLNGKAGSLSGIEYPYLHPLTEQRVTSRVRLDCPSLKSDGTPDKKYLTPYGDLRTLFFPPGVSRWLSDATVPVVFTESEKAALAATAAAARAERRVVAIACGGCWSWRGRIGKQTNATGARVDTVGSLPRLRSCHVRAPIVLDHPASMRGRMTRCAPPAVSSPASSGSGVPTCDMPISPTMMPT